MERSSAFHSDAAHATPSVLIVDDRPANLLALSAVLAPIGVRVVEATSGAAAIEHVLREPFAVMLLDVQMPRMDGFEVARRVRETANGRELPILFMTAIHRDEAYARKGYACGAADYITKPFDADVVRARVKAFADLFRQREGIRRAQVALRTHERDEAVRRLVAFEQIATAALEESDLSALLHKLLGVFLSAADAADSAAVHLRDGDALRVHASIDLRGGPAWGPASTRVGDGFVGLVAERRAPVETPLDAGDARCEGPRRLYGVPLLSDGEVLGVAHVGASKASTFSEAEKRLFVAVAERAAWAVAKNMQRSRLHDVLNAAPALISIVRGAEHRYEFVNPACRALFVGQPLVGERAAEVMGPDVVGIFERVHGAGEVVSHDEYAITTDFAGDGRPEQRFFSLTAQPLRNSTGTAIDGILLFAMDVTAHVRARRALEAHQTERAELLERERVSRVEAEVANRLKDEFLATISHELRTPLNAIVGWTAVARAKGIPEVERALSVVERNAQVQARIIDDVLDMSRIMSGKLSLDIQPASVAEPIHGAVESVRTLADKKGVRLDLEMDDVRAIPVDADRLQQVVWNLLSNAIKFTPPGGRVHLRVRQETERLVIVARDTGIGIAPEFLRHLFEPFRQADASATRRYGGLGLGLAIVKQLVSAHGGTIRAESAGRDQGATFTVELPAGRPAPVEYADGHAPPSARRAGLGADGRRLDALKVLVVDDEEDARSLLEGVFTDEGATVSSARSAHEALEVLQRFRPDVLLSDIGMPEADGYTLIRRVRELPPERGGATPAIALTAYARAEDREQAECAGFQRHIPKPVDLARLITTIADLARRRATGASSGDLHTNR